MSEDFDYLDFGSTYELTLNDGAVVVGEAVALADLDTNYDARAIFRTVPDTFDSDWTMTFRVEVGPETSDYLREDDTPYQADGFAVVWATSSTYLGDVGGNVGYFAGTGVASSRGLAFRLWEYLDLIWSVGGAFTDRRTGKDWRGDLHYWVEYDAEDEELRVYVSSTAVQPDTPEETFSGVSFGPDEWYVGITSATGAATMNAFLKAWSFEGSGGPGWGMIL